MGKGGDKVDKDIDGGKRGGMEAGLIIQNPHPAIEESTLCECRDINLTLVCNLCHSMA